MFFATNLFEILQVQNIIIELKLTKENTILALWVKTHKIYTLLLNDTEIGLFNSIVFFQKIPFYRGKKILGILYTKIISI